MEKMRSKLIKLLYPGWLPVLLVTAAGGGSLYLTFRTSMGNTPLAYVSYVLSFYALVVLVAGAISTFSALWERIRAFPLVHRYGNDKHFAVSCGLVGSFFISLGFAILKMACALLYGSFWDGALAVYHILLCGVRLFLILRVRRDSRTRDPRLELDSYRITGFSLMVLDLALIVIAAQIVMDGYGYNYPGMLIYAIAAYTFYSLTFATVNTIRYRKLHNPILSAAKVVNLTTALVAIFNLETAMLAQFGADEGESFRLVMTACTAITVCAIVLGVAVRMVLYSGAELKKTAQTR